MTKAYKTKTCFVKAEQFRQFEPWPDCVRHLPDGLHPKGYVAYLDSPAQMDEWVPIKNGDWIVTGPNGKKIVLPDFAFTALFERVAGDDNQ